MFQKQVLKEQAMDIEKVKETIWKTVLLEHQVVDHTAQDFVNVGIYHPGELFPTAQSS